MRNMGGGRSIRYIVPATGRLDSNATAAAALDAPECWSCQYQGVPAKDARHSSQQVVLSCTSNHTQSASKQLDEHAKAIRTCHSVYVRWRAAMTASFCDGLACSSFCTKSVTMGVQFLDLHRDILGWHKGCDEPLHLHVQLQPGARCPYRRVLCLAACICCRQEDAAHSILSTANIQASHLTRGQPTEPATAVDSEPGRAQSPGPLPVPRAQHLYGCHLAVIG